jgi:hypothetical protein
MMKAKFFLIYILLFLNIGVIDAQITNPIYLSMGLGISIPVIEPDFSKVYTPGPALTIAVSLKMNENIIAKAEFGYNHFYLKENTNISGLDIESYNINLNIGKFNIKGLTPYGIVGMGAYTLSDFSSSQTNIGFNFGFGLSGSYKNKITPYGEIQLNYNLTSGFAKGFIPVRAGIIFSL